MHYSFMRILTGSDLARRRLPVMSAVSPDGGPLVWLTACLHGEEVSGIVVVQEVFKRLRRELQRGQVHAFPLVNPLGFETGSRTITLSGEDLNRSFPGDSTGSLSERIAQQVFETIVNSAPALVLDLHNDWNASMPYAVLDHKPGAAHLPAWKLSLDVARRSGFCIICESEPMTRSLSGALHMADIPAVTFELGGPNVVSETDVAHGVGAIWNILAALEMVKAPDRPYAFPLPRPYGNGRVLRYLDKPRVSRTGIIRFLAKPGDTVTTGQPLAKVVNAFGRNLETVNALHDAIVLGHTDSSAAFPGKSIMAFGVADD